MIGEDQIFSFPTLGVVCPYELLFLLVGSIERHSRAEKRLFPIILAFDVGGDSIDLARNHSNSLGHAYKAIAGLTFYLDVIVFIFGDS